MYKESKYTLTYKNDDHYLLFNTYSGSICDITSEEYEEYRLYINKKHSENDILIETLHKLGFLIDEDKDETKILNLMRIRNALQTQNLFFRIIPSTACNARCFYCYEEGIKFDTMDQSIIPSIIQFISNHIKNDTKHVTIQWYGGEPLLQIDTIKKITIQLKELFKKRKVNYTFSMISNGILLNQSMMHIIKNELEIKKIQITLDGYGETYNKRKSYIQNMKNPFEKIIKNIDLLEKNHINVNIRLNCDGTNFENMKMLIEFLGYKYTKSYYVNVYAYPLYGCYKKSKNKSDSENILDKNAFLEIVTLLIKNGLLKVPNFKIRKNSCGATHLNSFFILPNGNLVKCMMDTNDTVGNVFTGVKLNDSYFKWCDFNIPNECLNCKILPLCQGGCRAGHCGLTQNKCFVYKDIINELLLLNDDLFINN